MFAQPHAAFDRSETASSAKCSQSIPAKFNIHHNQQGHKRLNYITELDLFKLAAINLPRHTLLHSMPVTLQVESTEINRMRTHFIKVMLNVWRSYSRHVLGTQCPLLGTFTQDAELFASPELAEIAGVAAPEVVEELPALSLAAVAKDSKTSEGHVLQCLRLVLGTSRNIMTKRWFNKIKLQMSPSLYLLIQRGAISILKTAQPGERISQPSKTLSQSVSKLDTLKTLDPDNKSQATCQTKKESEARSVINLN
jgi:AraC-like DNA-binding protein